MIVPVFGCFLAILSILQLVSTETQIENIVKSASTIVKISKHSSEADSFHGPHGYLI